MSSHTAAVILFAMVPASAALTRLLVRPASLVRVSANDVSRPLFQGDVSRMFRRIVMSQEFDKFYISSDQLSTTERMSPYSTSSVSIGARRLSKSLSASTHLAPPMMRSPLLNHPSPNYRSSPPTMNVDRQLSHLRLAALARPPTRRVSPPQCQATAAQPPEADMPLPPVVILPGFGNADIDYKTPLGQAEDKGLVSVLKRRGFSDVHVLDLPRWEWLRVAGGLVDPLFWLCKQRPDAIAYGWYIRRARAAIEAASARSGGKRVLVIAHSAGGWLARAVLADGEWASETLGPHGQQGGQTQCAPIASDTAREDEPSTGAAARREVGTSSESVVKACDVVSGLITLGAPHFPPPDGLQPCATRGALAFCDLLHPGAHLKSQGVFYLTVAGAAIEGAEDSAPEIVPPTPEIAAATSGIAGAALELAPAAFEIAPRVAMSALSADRINTEGGGSAPADRVYAARGEGSTSRVAYTNYRMLAGNGRAVGDGVIPVDIAHLEGAIQVTLDGVLHSINEAGTTLPTDRWYGSEAVVDKWLEPTMVALRQQHAL